MQLLKNSFPLLQSPPIGLLDGYMARRNRSPCSGDPFIDKVTKQAPLEIKEIIAFLLIGEIAVPLFNFNLLNEANTTANEMGIIIYFIKR